MTSNGQQMRPSEDAAFKFRCNAAFQSKSRVWALVGYYFFTLQSNLTYKYNEMWVV